MYSLNNIFNFFKRCCKSKKPKAAIFLDFDDTLAKPARKATGEYDVKPDGSIAAILLNPDKLRHLIDLSIKHEIPMFILTGRPDASFSHKIITDVLSPVGGFSKETIGGFKGIYFTSKMEKDEHGVLKRKEIATKLAILKKIHESEFDHLPKSSLLAVDDMREYLDPITAAGYGTIQAKINSEDHYSSINDFIATQTLAPMQKIF